MVSLYRDGKRHVVQVNELPGRPRKFFRVKRHAEDLRAKVEVALDRGDLEAAALLVKGRPRETIEWLSSQWLLTGLPDRTKKQTKLLKTRLSHALNGMGVTSLSKFTLDAATTYSHSRKDVDAPKTHNERISILKSFSKWLFMSQRTESDRLQLLKPVTNVATFERRALSFGEVTLVAATTLTRPTKDRLRKHPNVKSRTLNNLREMSEERLLAVGLCWGAALRIDEVRVLSWGRLDLALGRIRFHPRASKARRTETAYLPPWLLERLQERHKLLIERIEGIPDPHSRVVKVVTQAHRWFEKDAETCGLDPYNPDAKVDLHALRHSISTYLTEQGVDPFLADLYTRHQRQDSERAKRYVHGRAPKMQEIADMVPDLFEAVSTLVSTSGHEGGHRLTKLTPPTPETNKPKPPEEGDLGLIDAS